MIPSLPPCSLKCSQILNWYWLPFVLYWDDWLLEVPEELQLCSLRLPKMFMEAICTLMMSCVLYVKIYWRLQVPWQGFLHHTNEVTKDPNHLSGIFFSHKQRYWRPQVPQGLFVTLMMLLNTKKTPCNLRYTLKYTGLLSSFFVPTQDMFNLTILYFDGLKKPIWSIFDDLWVASNSHLVLVPGTQENFLLKLT